MTTSLSLSQELGVSADSVRALIRRRGLSELGTVLGTVKVYSPEEADRIRAALRSRRPVGRPRKPVVRQSA